MVPNPDICLEFSPAAEEAGNLVVEPYTIFSGKTLYQGNNAIDYLSKKVYFSRNYDDNRKGGSRVRKGRSGMKPDMPKILRFWGCLGLSAGACFLAWSCFFLIYHACLFFGDTSRYYHCFSACYQGRDFFLGALAMAAGIGTLRRKPWGHECFIALAFFTALFSLSELFLFGTLLNLWFLGLKFAAAAFIFFFFNTGPARDYYALSKGYILKMRVSYLFQIILILCVAGGYLSAAKNRSFLSAGDIPFRKGSIRYTACGGPTALGKRVFWTYEIGLPAGCIVDRYLNFHPIGVSVYLHYMRSSIIVTDQTGFESLEPLQRMLNITDGREFGKKLICDKIGLIPRIGRRIAAPLPGSFSEIDTGDWKGLLNKNAFGYEFFLWHKKTGASLGLFFFVHKRELSEKLIREIVLSLKINPVHGKGEDYFAAGLLLARRKRYEDAKYQYINAIYRDPENPAYYFQLGKAFSLTNNWLRAAEYLSVSLSLDSSNAEAVKLMDFVRKKIRE
ncbi:MAG: tetratricopeptide repeat protein [Bacillota bacterium]